MIGCLRIEIAGRLVGEKDARRIGDGTGDGDALLLATREFGRPVGLALAKAEIGQKLGGPALASA